MPEQPVPTCNTGFLGRLRFILRELRDIVRQLRGSKQ